MRDRAPMLRAFGVLLLAPCALAAKPVELEVEPEASPPPPRYSRPLLRLMTDKDVNDARRKYSKLMMMMHATTDPTAEMVRPMFKDASDSWPNITFALVDLEGAPQMAKTLHAAIGEIPKYGLSVEGISGPVRYTGGFSEKSLSRWLRQQDLLTPREVASLKDVEELVRQNKHGLVAIALLTEAQRKRNLLEVAARGADTHCTIAYGTDELAMELKVDVPSFVVANSEPKVPWARLHPPMTQLAVESFLAHRAMPLLVPISDSDRSFKDALRKTPLSLQVLLVHTSGSRGRDEHSERAIIEVRRAAAKFPGRAVFVSYDFFGNDPEPFTSREVYASELPAVLVTYKRGEFDERTWRLPEEKAGPLHDIEAEEVEDLVNEAMRDIGKANQKPPDGWDTIPAPAGFATGRVVWESGPAHDEL